MLFLASYILSIIEHVLVMELFKSLPSIPTLSSLTVSLVGLTLQFQLLIIWMESLLTSVDDLHDISTIYTSSANLT
ncbi:MAG: hypothetical protein ACMG6E_09180, partial [Candidatus Roizmanbacteria bacterium]